MKHRAVYHGGVGGLIGRDKEAITLPALGVCRTEQPSDYYSSEQ
jgi:hypothetical protein